MDLPQAIRNSGSAAQNMAHVACGKLDVYYEDGYGGPWDVVAGCAIVTEAGGVIRAPEGGPYELKMGKGTCLKSSVTSRILVPPLPVASLSSLAPGRELVHVKHAFSYLTANVPGKIMCGGGEICSAVTDVLLEADSLPSAVAVPSRAASAVSFAAVAAVAGAVGAIVAVLVAKRR